MASACKDSLVPTARILQGFQYWGFMTSLAQEYPMNPEYTTTLDVLRAWTRKGGVSRHPQAEAKECVDIEDGYLKAGLFFRALLQVSRLGMSIIPLFGFCPVPCRRDTRAHLIPNPWPAVRPQFAKTRTLEPSTVECRPVWRGIFYSGYSRCSMHVEV